MANKHQNRRSVRRAARRAMIDALEPRRLLTGFVLGTDNADSFVISVGSGNQIDLIYNGQHETVNPSSDGVMEVDGFGGNDTITLINTGTLTWKLVGGAGDDTYTVGGGNIDSTIHGC